MSCQRCQGLICREPLEKYGRWWWKCINCGDRIDAVILRHRAEQEADIAFRREAQDRDLKEWASWFPPTLCVENEPHS